MTEHDTPPEPTGEALVAPVAPSVAAGVFGGRIGMAEQFATILADTGVSHGLIGPREVPIVWERHILNCAVAQEAFPEGVEVVDVGSGAGLPGLALAIARPDLHLHLVEPMLRRTTWLSDTITQLGLTNCTVQRGRAEEFHGVLTVAWATARAVARIDKLARWTFPLLAQGGTLVALKGSSAQDELEATAPTLRKLGMTASAVEVYGEGLLDVPTVTLTLQVRPQPTPKKARKGR
ncbi:16S rRNA (guanine(527)-N(7))-methyltransferase RsmG [Pedococcus sp. KACC 23699]|uniref:Ribosomal RNA small subunit methyltransferase G n=1 Tax=Pedococcus sp. KACC 23699 TaxID=3149228 RepID=A0AAU7JYE7_9MICO